jgi:hypothetical protein
MTLAECSISYHINLSGDYRMERNFVNYSNLIRTHIAKPLVKECLLATGTNWLSVISGCYHDNYSFNCGSDN